ncbi:hypothetical protein, partial [Bizionia saleffrena]|uniref:hypothetical protein n=1 Tax=Bizionia saleffrena TaxID=291189 RepID=UPI0014793283
LVMLFFGVTFVLSSCQKEDDFTRSSQAENSLSPKFKISKINKERIEDNELIIKKLNRLNESINKGKIISRNRTIYSDEFDFYVDTNYATYTESLDGNYHSYTFPIIPLIESDTLQNLVLTLQPDNSYETLLVTYALTAQEKESIEKGNIVNLNNKITFNKIDNDSFVTGFLSKEGCTYTIEEYCSSGDHNDSIGYGDCGIDF